MKKIIIAGGTGFIGRYLNMRFREMGYQVLIVSRNSEELSWTSTDLSENFENAEMVINLAGKSINCRHNPKNRQSILESRIESTTLIGNAILNCKKPPKVWINASAAGIYQSSEQQMMYEDETELGNDFLAEVVKQWEKTFFDFQLPKTRQVALRTSVVLGRGGGALQPLVWLTRFGLGGKQGRGSQIFSWVHIEDYFRIVMFILNTGSINAVINCTSPQSVSNNTFMNSLQNTLRIPVGICAPKFAIELVSKIVGIEPELLLNSSFVYPKRLMDSGFKFQFPDIDKALNQLLR